MPVCTLRGSVPERNHHRCPQSAQECLTSSPVQWCSILPCPSLLLFHWQTVLFLVNLVLETAGLHLLVDCCKLVKRPYQPFSWISASKVTAADVLNSIMLPRDFKLCLVNWSLVQYWRQVVWIGPESDNNTTDFDVIIHTCGPQSPQGGGGHTSFQGPKTKSKHLLNFTVWMQNGTKLP